MKCAFRIPYFFFHLIFLLQLTNCENQCCSDTETKISVILFYSSLNAFVTLE